MYHLAIDIGASSGRHLVGWRENGALRTREVYRFPNGLQHRDSHLVWDLEHLERQVLLGIREALRAFGSLDTLSIDTWGIDYVLLAGEEPLLPCYSYRDRRTDRAVEEVHRLVPFETLYERTGCQFQPFNTIYQLYADKLSGKLDRATDLLMIPEYLLYRLTGVKSREYTNATTTGLVQAAAGQYDPWILDRLALPRQLFPRLLPPGTVLGPLKPETAEQVGGSCTVVLCATHDTASAVEGIPMEGNHPYISSGTWSLLGLKVPQAITGPASRRSNYSNEGGVGYIRYQKNIMGMWLLNSLREELCPAQSFPEILQQARGSGCSVVIDANAPELLSPECMQGAFDRASGGRLHTVGDYFRCACLSLAESYRQAMAELAEQTGSRPEKLYIVGGGARNTLLNELTAERTGLEVTALPIEATALGNLNIQMEGRT